MNTALPPIKYKNWHTFAYKDGWPVRAKGNDGKTYWMARIIEVEIDNHDQSVFVLGLGLGFRVRVRALNLEPNP